MKKEYKAPKVEKIEFEYSETVVASGTGCGGEYLLYINGYDKCHETPTQEWAGGYNAGNGEQ